MHEIQEVIKTVLDRENHRWFSKSDLDSIVLPKIKGSPRTLAHHLQILAGKKVIRHTKERGINLYSSKERRSMPSESGKDSFITKLKTKNSKLETENNYLRKTIRDMVFDEKWKKITIEH